MPTTGGAEQGGAEQEPVVRGGEATAENVLIVCRAHNQHAAERGFGAGFMERKRAEARRGGRNEGGVMRPRSCCLPSGS